MFGKRRVYRARVANVLPLASPVPLQYVRNALPTWQWATYPRSFTTPPSEIVGALRSVLDAFQVDIEDEAVESPNLTEGRRYYAEAKRYERDPHARAACVLHYGAFCSVCDFDFGSVYGDDVEKLIIVHHLTPLATRDRAYVVDPVKHLRPVCANCHLVIHRKDPPYTIAQVRKMIRDVATAAKDPEGA